MQYEDFLTYHKFFGSSATVNRGVKLQQSSLAIVCYLEENKTCHHLCHHYKVIKLSQRSGPNCHTIFSTVEQHNGNKVGKHG